MQTASISTEPDGSVATPQFQCGGCGGELGFVQDLALDGSGRIVAAGVASLVLAVFSLSLPHTPPRPATQASEKLAWLEAMKLLRIPFVMVLFVVTFFDSAVHQMYFFLTGKYLVAAVGIPTNWVMPVMSIGQIAEIELRQFR